MFATAPDSLRYARPREQGGIYVNWCAHSCGRFLYADKSGSGSPPTDRCTSSGWVWHFRSLPLRALTVTGLIFYRSPANCITITFDCLRRCAFANSLHFVSSSSGAKAGSYLESINTLDAPFVFARWIRSYNCEIASALYGWQQNVNHKLVVPNYVFNCISIHNIVFTRYCREENNNYCYWKP